LFTFDDLSNLTSLAKTLKAHADLNSAFLYGELSATTKQALAAYDGTSALPAALAADLSADLKVLLETWSPLRDLLESGPDDLSFVAEMDDDGRAHLRFGDSNLSQMPDAGTAFQANYRTGNGTAGNVGAESIRYIVLEETLSGVNLQPRNPLAASGGTDPEPVAEVKLFAPNAFRDVLERAITADDYATLASDNGRRLEERADRCSQPFQSLQSAKAVLRWNGSWYTALVALDPLGTEQSSLGLIHEVKKYLEPYRRVGHDLLVAQAEYVALDLALTICVLPGYLRAHVESALLNVFSNRVLSNGSKGFFHPDNLSFGDGIFASTIIAAAQAVAGVQNVTVTRLERWELIDAATNQTEAAQVPTNSVLTLGPLEIARLDNDPNFPENGRLSLDMRGGR
jgi:predicted phage baseplate assembly protein